MSIARVAELRIPLDERRRGVGSGYLLTDRLVLTAAHVVQEKGSLPAVEIELDGGARATGSTVWVNPDLDAALVLMKDPPLAGRGRFADPLRWGRLTGSEAEVPAHALGFPDALRDENGERMLDDVSGTVNPGVERGQRYDLKVTGEHPISRGGDPSPWSGLSGAALLSGRLVMGVVRVDTPRFQSGRLSSVPAWRLLRDQGFRSLLVEHGCRTQLESVELVDLFVPPRWRDSRLSPAGLLGADAEVVPFHGRASTIGELQRWCHDTADVSTYLITGPPGQGKTRLAAELCRVLREECWIAGFVSTGADQAIERLPGTIKETPLLLVIDYADSRTLQIESLITTVWTLGCHAKVRVLLLARSDGEWWEHLQRRCRQAVARPHIISLARVDIDADHETRTHAYQKAIKAFATALSRGDLPAEWCDVAAGLPTPDLSHERFASILRVHMTALNDLLEAVHGPLSARDKARAPEDVADDLRLEDELLLREEDIWMRNAADRGLNCDLRTLTLAMAVATLCGASEEAEAVALIERIPGSRGRNMRRHGHAVARWLHDLLPGLERYWGPLQPDLLGERLIERVAENDPEFVSDVLEVASPAQRELAITVIARIGDRLRHEGQLEAARRWYGRAAERDHHDAEYQLGLLLLETPQHEIALDWWRRAAANRHLDAGFALARALVNDGEVKEAKLWYAKAAEGGHLDAAFELARLWRAEGNEREAKVWYEKAARLGHNHAACELGCLLVEADDDEHAKPYLEQAADEYREAAFELAEIWWRERRPDLARPLFDRARRAGHAHAGYQLGCLERDHGEPSRTESLWREAADRGDQEARYQLAERYRLAARFDDAVTLYESAAADGHEPSRYQLAHRSEWQNSSTPSAAG